MSGSCATCVNIRFDSKERAYECHGYVPEIGDDGWGRWPRVNPGWDCRQYLASLIADGEIPDKNSASGVFHPKPE